MIYITYFIIRITNYYREYRLSIVDLFYNSFYCYSISTMVAYEYKLAAQGDIQLDRIGHLADVITVTVGDRVALFVCVTLVI